MVSTTNRKDISNVIYHIGKSYYKDFIDKVEGWKDGVVDDYIYFVYVKNYLHSSMVRNFQSSTIAVNYISEGEEKIVIAENVSSKFRMYFERIPIILVGENPKTKELDIIL